MVILNNRGNHFTFEVYGTMLPFVFITGWLYTYFRLMATKGLYFQINQKNSGEKKAF